MLADDMHDLGVVLKCPNCKIWSIATMNYKKGHFEATCWYCKTFLAWGAEQDIEKGTFKGKAITK